MFSEMTLKSILFFMSICLALGRPPSLPGREDLQSPSSRPTRVKVPPYMLHLYQMLMDDSKGSQRPESQILQESDTVQSLPAKDCTVEDNRWSLMFDVHSVSRGDDLQLVELRVHLPPFKTISNITVEIYHSRNGQSNVFLESITTTVSASHHSSWKSFNITKMMEQYLHWGNKETNHKRTQAMKIPRSIQMLASHSENSKKPNEDRVPLQKTQPNQAIIVFFSKERSLSKAVSPSPGLIKRLLARPKRMAVARSPRNRRGIDNRPSINSTSPFSMPEEEQRPLCRKVDMMVDFKKIGWDNWILYPKRYNAFRCEGTCYTPRKHTSKSASYDYIKSLIDLKELERVECSSCAPVKMRPLSILFNEGPVLVMRYQKDMIIEECGSL